MSLLDMLTGHFETGLAKREARWRKTQPLSYPSISQPMWLGEEPVEGKTILVVSDEGLGDAIQFARYLLMLADRGARVVLLVQDALHPLLSGMPGLSRCFAGSAGAQLVIDMHCPMASLPLAFRTRLDTIPAATAYLPAPSPERERIWEDRLGARDRLRIGLVWSGSPTHANDHHRSVPLRLFSRIIEGIDATFVSLQKDPRAADRAVLAQTDILDLTADLTDFAETAALVSCLDLVITVDTSVAHLAAASGRPTWILLPYLPDYRWMLGRDDSPWYPTVRLFRQTETREYASVLERVRSELQTLIAAARDHAASGEDNWAPICTSADTTADALCEAGFRHLRNGQDTDARSCCHQALAIDCCHADSMHLMGLLSLQSQQYDNAVEWIARAIRQTPKPEYLASLGTVLQRQGRLDEALKTFDKALQLSPGDAELWMSLGNVLLEANRQRDAAVSFQEALKLNPNHGDAAYRCGFLLFERGEYEESLFYFNRCVELRPDAPLLLGMRALALQHLKRFDEALADNKRAHGLDPDNADICNNIGTLLQLLGRDEEARFWFDRAMNLRPTFATALLNKAYSLQRLHRFDEAVAAYDRLNAIDPENAQAEWDLSLLQMLTGNFEAGWAGREARWRLPAFSAYTPKYPQPLWLGKEDIDGKTILLYADEGLGDSIQFARYVPMVAARGARIVLVVEPAALPLLSGMPGVWQCLPRGADALPEFDFHCPLSSLPLAFGTTLETIPSAAPYLPPPPEARVRTWEDRLGRSDKLRVGLVWSGNPNHINDSNRSIPFRTFARILDTDASFVSLQKDPRSDDAAALLERTDIIDLTADLTDFAETAALVGCLDLLITVDTSVAHLAAALGLPTWILLPYLPDYRWLLGRDDSPWYPTVRLFRQSETRDYGEVLDRVRRELVALIASR